MKNNKTIVQGIFAAVLGVASVTATATPIATSIINDVYWGSNDHGYGDVISSASSKDFFNIDHLQVVFNSDHTVNVKVYTGFIEGDARAEGTKYGDLFISTTGWHPYAGTDPLHFKQDSFTTTGTKWNYVIDTSEGGALYGGPFNVYQSQDLIPSGYIYRNGQVVQRKSGGTRLDTTAVLFGNENYGGKNYQTLTYTFNAALLGIQAGQELAFKWSMTCANDSIEGGVRAPSLPSPAPMSLLVAGVAAAWLLRKRRRVTI